MAFDKSADTFPIKKNMNFLAHCSISPLYKDAAEKAIELVREQQTKGFTTFGSYYIEELERLRTHSATLLRTSPDNAAFVRNTTEAISMVANGYPFKPGDEVISFIHEYPANHYPWRLQEHRGVKLKLLSNQPAREDIDPQLVGTWSMEELHQLVTEKTKVIALSHVQFTSGYAADLKQLGGFCREQGIDLVIDAAQSLGSMPVYPEEYNISALASAGWKWLMGPFATGVFYTSEAFRQKLRIVQAGSQTMQQGMDFLDHTWNPHPGAQRFEYSSAPPILVAALATAIQEVHVRYGADAIFQEILRLQDIFLEHLDHTEIKPLLFPSQHRSGILSLAVPDVEDCTEFLKEQGIACTGRGGLLRVAPHFYNTEEEVIALAEAMNGFGE